tara:strand:- start:141 stop:1187 length:1047 start_codon:yes stop_codon:yes gene_type:complete
MSSGLWGDVSPLGWGIVLAFLILAFAPIYYAWRQRIPISLAIVASLLLCWVFQTILQFFDGTRDFLLLAFATNPMWQTSPIEFHRLFTAAWLHAAGRGGGLVFQHILGNVLVIALVGVPLEQRLGRGRFLTIYLIGAVAGNLAWWFSHWGEFRFALGASGAAFGLLGCYLACWPRDEIEFPLVLIRKWPISLIALLKLGLEIAQVGLLYGGWTGSSSIAHLAHIGGFFVCYAVARPIAKGGPTPPEIRDGGPSAYAAEKGDELQKKNRMGGLKFDPWDDAGKPLEGKASHVLQRLREEGDELETRRAWLEELSEVARCPNCDSELKVEISDEVAQLHCENSRKHLLWP